MGSSFFVLLFEISHLFGTKDSGGLGTSSFSDKLVISLSSFSSVDPPWACDWWYFKPFIFLYFFEQFGSGHSSSTGEVGGGLPLPLLVTGVAGEGGGGREVVDEDDAPGAGLVFFPFTGDCCCSSSDRFFRLVPESGRGGTNGVGDEAGGPLRPLLVLLFPLLFVELLLRSLLWTEDRVSVKLLKSLPELELLEPLPRLPLPFGVRASRSLVGESQNLKTKKKDA